MYPVIASPPLETGATHATLRLACRASTVTPVGAPGVVAGLPATSGEVSADVPTEFVATTPT